MADIPTAVHAATLPEHTPESFKPLIAKLVKSPHEFTKQDTILAFEHLLDPSSTFPNQIGSFLTALHLSGREADAPILAGGADVLRRHAILVDVPQEEQGRLVVDIVGTGGDGHNTFNVSTTAAIVAAGAGARVYKHGNRASTSSSGSADLLFVLGCPLSSPTNQPSPSLPSPPFRFLLAPHHHPLLAPLAPIRRSTPHRTILNLLGPLVNPARPSAIVLGVAHPSLGPTFLKAVSEDEKIQRAWIVCGQEGLDEISCAGPTHVWDFQRGREEGECKEFVVEPATFGLSSHSLESVKGGKGPSENGLTFLRLLDPSLWTTITTTTTDDDDDDNEKATKSPSKELDPVFDFVLINAAAVLVVSGIANDLPHGVSLARESILSGNAWDAFCKFREWDQSHDIVDPQ